MESNELACWLWAEELGDEVDGKLITPTTGILQSRLAECRRVMKKNEWVESPGDKFSYCCLECGAEFGQTALGLEQSKKQYPDWFKHEPDCAYAACIAGFPREV
jgi:hypothetical protein